MDTATAAGERHPRVLIVEDEAIVALDLQQTLTSLGYEVTGMASSGADALELASLMATDLILMDIRIQGNMDGIATAEEIRQRLNVPVVFLTAHADAETLLRANKTEPYGYVVKPFKPADVTAAVEVALNRYRLTDALTRQEVWFHTVLNSISDAVIAIDFDGLIRFMNTASEVLTGWSAADCVGKPMEEMIPLALTLDELCGWEPDLRYVLTEAGGKATRSTGTLRNREGKQVGVSVISTQIARVRGRMYQGRVLVVRGNGD